MAVSDAPGMPSLNIHDGYAECAVCRSDTRQLCSPCGDPVCHHCACPNGCEAIADGVVDPDSPRGHQFAFDVAREAA
jgi:hypothetical protein